MTEKNLVSIQVDDLKECPICGGAFNGEKINGNNLHYRYGDTFGLVYYYQCGTCKAWALSPRMTDVYVKEYYRREYREVAPVKGETARTRAFIQYGLVGDLLPGKTMLDVGCSRGFLMYEFSKRGFACVGVDPDTTSVSDYASIEDVPEQKFDVIACSHTLEHFNYPKAALQKMLEYARPGTRLMIDVPNYPTCFPGGLYQHHHPILFDLGSLTWLLESVGCKVIFDTIHGDGTDKPNNLLVVAEVV